MQFTYIQAPRDLQETDIKALYESLLKKLEELGASESAWLSALDHWNELKAYLEGEYARRSYAEACNALALLRCWFSCNDSSDISFAETREGRDSESSGVREHQPLTNR